MRHVMSQKQEGRMGPTASRKSRMAAEAKASQKSPIAGEVTSAGKMSPTDPGMSVQAGEDVKNLGIMFAAVPPGYPDIKGVKEGTWAEEVGIKAGWTLFEVNGEDVVDMTKEVFVEHLKRRPLELYLEPPTPSQSDSEGQEGRDLEPRSRSGSLASSRGSIQRGSRASLLQSAGSTQRGSRASALQAAGSIQRGSRASVLQAAVERRRSSAGNAQAMAEIQEQEMELEETREEAEKLRAKVKQEISMVQSSADPSAFYEQLQGKLRNEKSEWNRVSDKLERFKRKEEDQVLDLEVEVEIESKRALAQQRLAEEAARQEDPQTQLEARELASLLAKVRRHEDAVALDKQRWQRMRRGSVFSLGLDIELKEEARIRDIETFINKEENIANDGTAFLIPTEQEEIRRLHKRLGVQEYRLASLHRAYRFDVATAETEANHEQSQIKKLEKMELKRLRRTEWENAQFRIRLDDPLCEEVACLRAKLPHEEKMEVQLQEDLSKLETLQKKVSKGHRHAQLELEALRAEGAQAAIKARGFEGKVQEHAAWVQRDKDELAEIKSYFTDGKQAPIKNALRREREQVRLLVLDHAKAEGSLKSRLMSSRQTREELDNLSSAYTEETSELGEILQQYLKSESSQGKWTSEFRAMRPKLNQSEALVGELRAEVYHHEQVQTEAEALTLDGPLGRAEIVAFEQTYREEQTLAEAQVRARNAARIADHAELSALRSVLKHEEAEVYKLTSACASGRDATEITTLRNALARERDAGSVSGAAYQEMWAEAQEGMAQMREVFQLRSQLMQGESVIGRLQEQLELSSPQSPESPAHLSRERAQVSRLRDILSSEQSMASQIRVKIAEAERQSMDASQLAPLKAALAGAAAEYGALQKRLLDRTRKGGPELAALRSALIVEQTELRMLKERAAPEPLAASSQNPFTAEAVQLRGELAGEELELQTLHHRLTSRLRQPPQTAPTAHKSAGDERSLRALQAEHASERAVADELERKLASELALGSHQGGAPPGSMAAAEIAVLKTELANAEAAPSPSVSSGGLDFASGVSQEYMSNPYARYDAVLSGSQLSHMARQVEAAELSRLEGIIEWSEEAAKRERAGHREAKLELRSLRLAVEYEEHSLELLKRRLGDVQAQERRVNAANETDLSGVKVAIIRKEAELEQLRVRLASAVQKQRSGREYEVVVPANIKSVGITTSLPPEPRVDSVRPDSWAATQGIEIGDMLQELNEQSVEYLSQAEFAKLMRGRPLRMKFSQPAMKAKFALESVKKKSEDERLRIQGQIYSLESELRQVEADRDLLKTKCGIAESEVAAKTATARTGYEGEMMHMQNALKNAEADITRRTQDELFGVAEKTKQATLAEEELAIQEVHVDNNAIAERITEEFHELGEMRAALMHEKRQAGRLHGELLRCRQERDQAELKATTSQSAHFEHVTTMRKSLLAVQVAQQEMEDMAKKKQQALIYETAQAAELRPKYMEALETVHQLQEQVTRSQIDAEGKESIRTIRAAEIDALKSKLSTEKVESSFSRHEVREVDALRNARSQEMAIEHRTQQALSGAEARLQALQIEQQAELSSLKAAVRHAEQIDNRISDNMGQQVVQLANLEVELHAQNEAVTKLQARSAMADLRNQETETALLEFEVHEESLISRRLLSGAARADARVIAAEAGTRTIEEQAACWCAEAAMDAEDLALTFPHRGFQSGDRKQQVQLLRQEMQLQRKLEGAESELQRNKRRAQAEGFLMEETAEMRLELTEETRAAHMAKENIMKARNAEARVLQNALVEVRDASLRSTKVVRERDALLAEEVEYRREAESQDDMLQDIREMMVQRAAMDHIPQPPPTWNAASLDSMLGAAHSMLDTGDPDVAAVDALVALSGATPGGMSPIGHRASPRTPGRLSGFGAAGGTSTTPLRDGLNTHASQLRSQAEGLRQDMARFQAARQGRRSYR